MNALVTIRPTSPGARRAPRPRRIERRMFAGDLEGGWLSMRRGCEVVRIDRDGTELERVRDASARLNRNIGDWLVVMGPSVHEVAALEVAGIVAVGWNERWRVAVVAGVLEATTRVLHVLAGGKVRR